MEKRDTVTKLKEIVGAMVKKEMKSVNQSIDNKETVFGRVVFVVEKFHLVDSAEESFSRNRHSGLDIESARRAKNN